MLLQKYRVMLPTVLASVAIILTVGFAVLFGNIKLSTVLYKLIHIDSKKGNIYNDKVTLNWEI